MKAYSVDLREKIVAAHQEKNSSIRTVASIFSVSKSLVQKLVKQQTSKKTKRSTQAGTERVLNLMLDYWEKVKYIDPKNLVFLDETGVILCLTRTHARSQEGTRAYSLNPFCGARSSGNPKV